ncbi:hypothetical protein QBC35DRAFT_386781 [Podospora australis]|uniref:Single-strand DNA deaminase toxin A-like C-terminal domain-containing protein n=1 Tax=Podospora australis TaxID=1536484 RepID=A0AAN7AHW7_9PEZI|nr:hypothetical protein QBC35DRAFT_386781 [Podospora australis]
MSQVRDCHSARKDYSLTELHVAVIKGDKSKVRRLLNSETQRNLQLHARDREGASPLMTAVLCGRLGIAKLLLRHGASTKARDQRGRGAKDYGRVSSFSRKLSIYKLLGFRATSRENKSERLKLRIVLQYPVALRSCRQKGKNSYSGSYILRSPKTLTILKPDGRHVRVKHGRVETDNLNSTSGFITSVSEPKIRRVAVSDYGPNEGRSAIVLGNVYYTQQVRDLAHYFNWKISKSMRDNGSKAALPEHQGRFYGCHVEKKLAVWWVKDVLKKVLRTTDLTRMMELREIELPVALKKAKIFLDHGPCPDVSSYPTHLPH